MTSYPYIQDLFTNVLKASKAIQGRFVMCVTGGEINSDEFGQVIDNVFEKAQGTKYPVALLMPPRSQGSYTAKGGEWEKYRFIMFFLKTTYADSNNQVASRNPNTGTSMHTIPQDWHDMKRCAQSFINILYHVQKTGNLVNTSFRVSNELVLFDPVSNLGKDRLSGVRMEFTASLFNACLLEDYSIQDIAQIQVPALDSHPEHKM